MVTEIMIIPVILTASTPLIIIMTINSNNN